jgi:fructose-1,6-bisphosphatase/inositol monophosphatase family enzyme
MSESTPDIDAVSAIINETARDLVLPRFRRLSSHAVLPKTTPGDPEDIVTIVDREVEERLARALTALSPAAGVIGEEATQRQPGLLRMLESDRALWLIDPIDGTKSFAADDDGFGIMVAYVVGGRTEAAWIALPARKQLLVAEAGSGAFANGARVLVPSAQPADLPRGALYVRYMPPALGEAVDEATRGRFKPMRPSGCAAGENTDILGARKDFVIYYRLLPWDHAAPALILTEAGGRVEHLDGAAYTARSGNQITVVSRDRSTAEVVRGWLKSKPEST